jgi:predicted transcriptional regulator YdeE
MRTLANNYIVRVYRISRKKPHSLVGVVEQVGVKEKKAFTNVQELWEILSHGEKIEEKANKGMQ